MLLSRTVNGLTNIWNYNLKDQGTDTDYFRNGPDFSPMPDPGGKGIYFVNGKVLRVPDCLQRPFKGIDGHCVRERNSARHLAGWKARDVRHGSCKEPERALGIEH